jgi:hypothetical protein
LITCHASVSELVADAEQPEQDDQAERHTQQPQQDQNHGLPPFSGPVFLRSCLWKVHAAYQALLVEPSTHPA